VGVEWEGIDELLDALSAMTERVSTATPRVVVAVGELVKERGQAKLELQTHERGTPTPSAKGDPPAKIDGTLRDSWYVTPPAPTGASRWTSLTGATTIYSRIQELGGWAGRDHASYLPPRPYLKPTYDDLIASGDVGETAARIWGQAITG
jgi:hypothetical protein